MTTKDRILSHCARYPLLQPTDLLKFLHQSTFGPGHLVSDAAGGLEYLRRESAGRTESITAEPLDGDFYRLHLGSSLSCDTLWNCFRLSSRMPRGTAEELEQRLSCACGLAAEGRLPFSEEDLAAALRAWRESGFPPQHHSEEFRAAYAPAYRVIHRSFVWMLPLLQAIDEKMQSGKPIILAIEGSAASGKSTLGHLLQQVYSCNLLHMDDFFLQPHQRTPERFAQAGGNFDRERFLAEVLLPLRKGDPLAYRRYDCHTQTILPPVEIPPAPLTVIEGVYSFHPELQNYCDLAVFLRISPELQRSRICRRNSEEFQSLFFDRWIPMEQQYFSAFSIPESCDLILEVNE